MIEINVAQGNKKEKCAQRSNKKEKDAEGVIEAIFRLIRPGVSLIMSGLLNWSLDFANIQNFLLYDITIVYLEN